MQTANQSRTRPGRSRRSGTPPRRHPFAASSLAPAPLHPQCYLAEAAPPFRATSGSGVGPSPRDLPPAPLPSVSAQRLRPERLPGTSSRHVFPARLPSTSSQYRRPSVSAGAFLAKEVSGSVMVARQLISSGSPFEATIGFSRAVRVGNRVVVSGSGPVLPDGQCPAGAGAQARRCFEIVESALREAGRVAGRRRADAHVRDGGRARGRRRRGARRALRRHPPRRHHGHRRRAARPAGWSRSKPRPSSPRRTDCLVPPDPRTTRPPDYSTPGLLDPESPTPAPVPRWARTLFHAGAGPLFHAGAVPCFTLRPSPYPGWARPRFHAGPVPVSTLGPSPFPPVP